MTEQEKLNLATLNLEKRLLKYDPKELESEQWVNTEFEKTFKTSQPPKPVERVTKYERGSKNRK